MFRIALASVAAILGLAGCGNGDPAQAPVEAVPAGPPWFEDVAGERGVDFVHRAGFETIHLMPESMGSGGGFCDLDGDGDLDIYLVQSGSLIDPDKRTPGNQLYENLGDGTFRNATAGSGTEGGDYGMGVACSDYDNDGDVDLYVTNYGPNRLYRNDGELRFSEVGEQAGVAHEAWGASAAWCDYDRDGDLDLFCTNYVNWSAETELDCYNQMGGADYCGPMTYNAPAMDVFYRNDGDGTFTDVTAFAGIDSGFGPALGVVCGDYDGDGWPDLFVANDAVGDQLWVNQHDGTFVDKALLAGCAVDLEGGVPKAGMGVTTGDVDDDGDLDLLVCNLFEESDSVYRNEGDYFTDVTARSGLGVVSRRFTRFGVGWVEFDNDGRFDLYQVSGRIHRAAEAFSGDLFAEPNLLFRGLPGAKFEEVKPRGGTAELLAFTSRGAAFGDFDDDGGIDVLISNRDAPPQLLRNIVADRGHWIRFRVIEEHGRDAEGARVQLVLPDRSLTRFVRTGYSYLSSNDPRVHFGLGEESGVEEVIVTWVDGATDRYGPFEADRTITLDRRGESR